MLIMIPSIPCSELLLRIVPALGAGLVIGWERESHGRAAGLRTTILVCVAAAIAMVLSDCYFSESVAWVGQSGRSGSWGPDPARLPAGILSGMGFLGAGAIIREGNVVRGVTTAAVLWFVTIIGLAFGSGHLTLGLMGWGVAMLVLFGLPKLESMIKSDRYGVLTVTTAMEGLSEADIQKRAVAAGAAVKRVRLDYDLEHQQRTIHCDLKYKRDCLADLSHGLVRDLAQCPAVIRVGWA